MPKAQNHRLPGLAFAALIAAGPAAASDHAPVMPLGPVEAPPAGFLELCSREPEHCTASAAPSAADLEVLRARASRTYFSLAFGRALPAPPASGVETDSGRDFSVSADPMGTTATVATKPFADMSVRTGFGRVAPAGTSADQPPEAPAAADLARPVVARVRDPETTPLTMDRADWRRVQRINSAINRSIRHRDDQQVYGRGDLWALGEAGVGDCEDYALAKRAALIQAGVPARALSIGLVRTRRGQSHAVLLIDTDKGAMVLDNLSPWIRRWDRTSYIWVARQAPGDPLTWRAVDA